MPYSQSGNGLLATADLRAGHLPCPLEAGTGLVTIGPDAKTLLLDKR